MKKIGLIGGTGPESTIAYYKEFVYGVQKRREDGNFPYLSIESLSVFDVLRLCESKQYGDLAAYLAEGVNRLAAAGADYASFTGITPHIVYDQVAAMTPIPIVSIIEAACEYAVVKDFSKIALFGTYPTMSSDFFQKPFHQHGIEIATPTEEEKQYIGGKIESELELGLVLPETQEQLLRIAQRMIREEQVQAIVLGCTELPMILQDGILPVPFLDVMRIHIDKLIDLALS